MAGAGEQDAIGVAAEIFVSLRVLTAFHSRYCCVWMMQLAQFPALAIRSKRGLRPSTGRSSRVRGPESQIRWRRLRIDNWSGCRFRPTRYQCSHGYSAWKVETGLETFGAEGVRLRKNRPGRTGWGTFCCSLRSLRTGLPGGHARERWEKSLIVTLSAAASSRLGLPEPRLTQVAKGCSARRLRFEVRRCSEVAGVDAFRWGASSSKRPMSGGGGDRLRALPVTRK